MNIPKINISEIYDSIQGEGYLTGTYMRFVRFQGCHIGCKWCDTKYSWSDKKGKKISALEVYNSIVDNLKLGQYICFTGGEPLEQYNSLYWLMNKLNRIGFSNLTLETSGSPIKDVIQIIDLSYFDGLFFSISPKLPSALKNFDEIYFNDNIIMWYNNIDKKYMIQLKFVVSTEEDLAFLDYYFSYKIGAYYGCHHYLQIEESKMNDKEFIDKCFSFINKYRFFRLGIQYHKLLGLR